MKCLLKKILVFAAALAFSFVAFAEGKSKSVVVYYSLTETTARLAERIASETGADLFRLETKNPYSTNMGKVNDEIKADKASGKRRELKSLPDLKNYDTVFVGTPVWSGDMADPVEAWLLLSDLKGKTVVPFCTYWSTGSDATLNHIAEMAQKNGAKTNSGLSQAHGKTADVKNFVKGL